MMKNFIIIILILLCSCCPNKQHAIIKADLVKVFDNYPLDSKGDENYTRKIHLVFRITNTTNDTFFIPMQAMGYDCNSKIHFDLYGWNWALGNQLEIYHSCCNPIS